MARRLITLFLAVSMGFITLFAVAATAELELTIPHVHFDKTNVPGDESFSPTFETHDSPWLDDRNNANVPQNAYGFIAGSYWFRSNSQSQFH